ncbi:hypothetical protein [Candidatus Skiveiella danica]|uniref:hypothetical protein n=1 Tax=Candidatus Skiveiella danica TaxID=3386177 RepID=UPI001D3B5FC8|nr:hypothetical protein [Betaproteobacteria bacterium]
MLKAILAACADAGIDPREIDGFASYANDRNDPARLAAALGIRQLRSATMQWGGGGGGCAAAVANGAAAIATGMAKVVVVTGARWPGQFGPSARAGVADGLRRDVLADALRRHRAAAQVCLPRAALPARTRRAARRCGPSPWPPTTMRRPIRAR